ncbi:RNA polymerase sigma-70 factor (sigma-E family) [Asanoa ferruginea]|uniref:RNA polymerase sigma-70 factor (Sigma-E family) n=1 Tax=Asanoa ferruginea TaxID=53367 RepID=A0A3D9ZH54_9ACTN|nr:sigma-70 family RNA polymerase sigma factor [Asanoa ferruginea]REF95203.1 RNA polymerase sigma-70 factor (sigma-E family) [Asanoa ferruginea]GIF52811.1 RNA polymerase sigma24 factor [Asanoa ferruginea]
MQPLDEEEFREFVTNARDTLRGLAYLTCGSWAMADDAVAAALSKLYVRWKRVAAPYPYARRMVVLAAIDETRRPWRRRERSASDFMPERPEPDRLGAIDDQLHVRAALAQVPPGQRAVLVLRFYEQLSVEETAEALGRSQGTVKSQTARGLAALRAALGDESDLRLTASAQGEQ